MPGDDKRKTIRYILDAPLNKLLVDYTSSDREKRQELLGLCLALFKKFNTTKSRSYQTDKLNKFIKLVTGVSRIKKEEDQTDTPLS